MARPGCLSVRQKAMSTVASRLILSLTIALLIGAGGPESTQNAHAQQANPPQTPTFRGSIDLVTTDVIPRDSRTNQFIANLKPGELNVYEDGVKQQVVSFVLTHGGKVYNLLSLASPNARKHFMHLAAAVGLFGAVAAAYRPGKAIAAGDFHWDSVPTRLQVAMAALCLMFVLLCVNSFIQARRRRAAGA